MDEIDTLKEAYLKIVSLENSNLTESEKQRCEFIKNKMKNLLRDLRDRNAKSSETS